MSLVKKTTRRTVTFNHREIARDAIIDTAMSWDTVIGIVKLLFELDPPFVLSFETKQGAHLELKHVGTLGVFLASNYQRHVIDINRNVPLGPIPFSNKGANIVAQRNIKSSKKATVPGDQKVGSSKIQNPYLKKERNTFDIMEEERAKNKKAYGHELNEESSSLTDTDSEAEVINSSKDPYTSFHEELSHKGTFVDEKEKVKGNLSKDPIELAKQLQMVCCNFKKLFHGQTSVQLVSEIIFDQIFHGVHIDVFVLERGLQRLAISTSGFSLTLNAEDDASLSNASSTFAKEVASMDLDLYNERDLGPKNATSDNVGGNSRYPTAREQFEGDPKHYKPKTKPIKENSPSFSFNADVFK